MQLQASLISFLALSLASSSASLGGGHMCTTIGYRSSTAQRSLVTHTADCKDCDFRVNKVPAAQHDLAKSPNRPIYKYHNLYPRIVAEERGSTWSADNLETAHAAAYAEPDSVASQIVGYLPEVEYTYGTFESLFGMMNDQQVAIGESTCAARFGENAIVRACVGCDGPLFEMSALTMIALERCATARCAVQMMGDLAVEHGFYGAETVEDERGEALTVSDTDEVWMFHISPDPSATSAIWVAQRVPDGHITAAANAFVIRGVKKDHPDFLYSENLWSAAESEGVLRTIGDDNDLDFTATYGPDEFAYHPDGTRDNKSMKKPEYCTDRVWRVLSLAAPSLNLKRETDFWGNGIPFSVPADKDLTVQDIMAMNRDHYEGVEGMDMREGLAAGPFGNPIRYDEGNQADNNLTDWDLRHGEFQRAIGMMRTSWSFVAESRKVDHDAGGILWYSQYQPSAGAYLPLFSSALEVPKMYTRGTLFEYSSESTFWKFVSVGNYIQLAWKYMNPVVQAKQKELEDGFVVAVEEISKHVKDMSDEEKAEHLTAFSNAAGQTIFDEWGALFHNLIATFHDGYHMDGSGLDIKMNEFFYPRWWLVLTDYFTRTLYDNDWSAPTEEWETVDNLWGAEDFRKISDDRVRQAEEKMGLTFEMTVRNKNFSAALFLTAGLVLGFIVGWFSSKFNENGKKHVYQALP